MFEGHRYRDIRRWKIAEECYATTFTCWNVWGTNPEEYYQLCDYSKFDLHGGTIQFITPKSYLLPILSQRFRLIPACSEPRLLTDLAKKLIIVAVAALALLTDATSPVYHLRRYSFDLYFRHPEWFSSGQILRFKISVSKGGYPKGNSSVSIE